MVSLLFNSLGLNNLLQNRLLPNRLLPGTQKAHRSKSVQNLVLCVGCLTGGKPDPPDPFRCKSKSITVVDSAETTVFGCPCCPGGNWLHCDDDICDGEEEEKCKREPVKGCDCQPRNPIYVGEYPVAYVCGAYASRFQRSTAPTEPPPASSEFWNLSHESCKDAGGENKAREHAASDILLRQISPI